MKNIPVLQYHNVCSNNDIQKHNQFMTVSVDRFKKDMDFIKNKYTTIFVSDLWNYVNNNIDLPDNCIMVTFDDGYGSIYEYVYPIVVELKIKTTISLIVNKINEPKGNEPKRNAIAKLQWDQIKEMYNSGYIDFQSHSYDMHEKPIDDNSIRRGCLKKDDESDEEYVKSVQQDYLQSKNEIENQINNTVMSYFYPFGKCSRLSNSALVGAGCPITFISVTNGEASKIVPNNLQSLFFIKRKLICQNTNLCRYLR